MIASSFENLTPATERLLKKAREVADSKCHVYIGTEHILVALMQSTDGIAPRILKKARITRNIKKRIIGQFNSDYP